MPRRLRDFYWSYMLPILYIRISNQFKGSGYIVFEVFDVLKISTLAKKKLIVHDKKDIIEIWVLVLQGQIWDH